MPRKLKSGGTYKYVLKEDRDESNPVSFSLLIPSVEEDGAIRDLTDEHRKATDRHEKSRLLQEALAIAVKGWNGIDQAFSSQALTDLLTPRECYELLGDVALEAALTVDERKKFESRSASETS
jgi:hypothetical protein